MQRLRWTKEGPDLGGVPGGDTPHSGTSTRERFAEFLKKRIDDALLHR